MICKTRILSFINKKIANRKSKIANQKVPSRFDLGLSSKNQLSAQAFT
jgi:hypothetical protein